MTANAYGQLIVLLTIAACAVVSFIQGWFGTGIALLVILVFLVF